MSAHISKIEVNAFMRENNKYFEAGEIERFKNIILNSNVSIDDIVGFSLNFKSPQTAICLSILLGWLGIDRFYSENYLMAFLKMCTFGGSGIWWAIDWLLIGNAVKKQNQSNFYEFLKLKTELWK